MKTQSEDSTDAETSLKSVNHDKIVRQMANEVLKEAADADEPDIEEVEIKAIKDVIYDLQDVFPVHKTLIEGTNGIRRRELAEKYVEAAVPAMIVRDASESAANVLECYNNVDLVFEAGVEVNEVVDKLREEIRLNLSSRGYME